MSKKLLRFYPLASGIFKSNQYKTKETHPDFLGYVTLNEDLKAGTKLQLSVWNKSKDDGSEYSSVSLTTSYQ